MKKVVLAVLLVAFLAGTAHAQSNPVGVQTTTPGTLEAAHVFSGTKVSSYSVTWHTQAARWVMVFDAASIPSDGAFTAATPLKDCQFVQNANNQADGSQNFDYTWHPLQTANGVTIVVSTNASACSALTKDGANNFLKAQVQ